LEALIYKAFGAEADELKLSVTGAGVALIIDAVQGIAANPCFRKRFMADANQWFMEEKMIRQIHA